MSRGVSTPPPPPRSPFSSLCSSLKLLPFSPQKHIRVQHSEHGFWIQTNTVQNPVLPITELDPQFFFSFLGRTEAYGSSQARSGISYSCRPRPQPQKCQNPSHIFTYTAAHGNLGSLTHWERPQVKPASSWILAGFVSAAPQQELPRSQYFIQKNWGKKKKLKP